MVELAPGNIPLSHRLHTTAERGQQKIPHTKTERKEIRKTLYLHNSQNWGQRAFASTNKCAVYFLNVFQMRSGHMLLCFRDYRETKTQAVGPKPAKYQPRGVCVCV